MLGYNLAAQPKVENRTMAMRTQDFTRLPIGTKVGKAEIQKCPHCGKPGLAETVYEKMFYTHSQSVGMNEEGNPVISWEMCPQQEKNLPQKTS